MKVLVVKDGTVPVLVAEVLATDFGPATEDEEYDELRRRTESGDLELETFEVEGSPEALDVSWADGEGFSVYGITISDWFKYRQEDECGGTIETVNGKQGELHFVQSDVCHGEDEHWYSHLFVIGGRA